jgi:hypothetical protein
MTQTHWYNSVLLGADTGSHTVHKRQRNDERQHIVPWRALGFLGMGIGKSIASRNEVQARQPGPLAEVKPIRDDLEQPFGDTKDIKEYATPKQRGMIRARAFDKNLTNTELLLHINKVTDSAFSSIEALSKQQASQVIDSLQN